VNSTGWVVRLATARTQANELFWTAGPDNPCGALAAACLGASLVFLTILNQQPLLLHEFSLFTHDDAEPGSLDQGPPLPSVDLKLDAFLVGCGAVSNGWAYTVKRLPIAGQIQAIDKQSLKIENMGPYVLASRSRLQDPKAALIQDYLAPRIHVTPRADEWELFKIRLNFGLAVPSIIVNGLDNVLTRHSVQRLWPDTLIDMAAGGLTSQVIVNRADDHVPALGPSQLVLPCESPRKHWFARPCSTAAKVIVSTYNELLITSEWAVAVFKEARAAGLLTAFVSNGNGTP